jgi:hypothetical protein
MPLQEDDLSALLKTIEAPSQKDLSEVRFAHLQWALEILARAGWTNDEILEAARERTRKPRGRPRDPDDRHIVSIKEGKRRKGVPTKIARAINDGHRKDESIVRRLTNKAKAAEANDKYNRQLKNIMNIYLCTPQDQWPLLDQALIAALRGGTGENTG